MNLASILTGFCLVSLFVSQAPARSGYFPEQAAEPPQATGEVRAADERALRALVAEFTRAFNAGDVKAVSALFSGDARLVTLTGRVINGRAAIEQLFASSFQEYSGQTIEVKTESLRFLGVDSAFEEGTATITSPPTPGNPAVPARPPATPLPTSSATANGFRTASVIIRCRNQPSSSRLTNTSRNWNGLSVIGSMRATKPWSTPPVAGRKTSHSCCDRFRSGSGGRPRFRAHSESAGILGSSRFAPGSSTPTGAFPRVSGPVTASAG